MSYMNVLKMNWIWTLDLRDFKSLKSLKKKNLKYLKLTVDFLTNI
jgi:hypothetical protein